MLPAFSDGFRDEGTKVSKIRQWGSDLVREEPLCTWAPRLQESFSSYLLTNITFYMHPFKYFRFGALH